MDHAQQQSLVTIVTNVIRPIATQRHMKMASSVIIATTSVFTFVTTNKMFKDALIATGQYTKSLFQSGKKFLTSDDQKIITNISALTKMNEYVIKHENYFDPSYFSMTTRNIGKLFKFQDDTHKFSGKIGYYRLSDRLCVKIVGNNANDYVSKIINEPTVLPQNLVLYNVIQNANSKTVNEMYNNVRLKKEDLENIFIKTIFHKEIDELWGRIETIHYHPENSWKHGICPRSSLLLYGPPGTGKSTFAYRIAMATGRHIINVKLTKYSIEKMHELFNCPQINGTKYTARDVVFVLDEFDIEVGKIMMKSICKEKQMDKINRIASNFFKAFASNLMDMKNDKAVVEKSTAPSEQIDETTKVNQSDAVVTTPDAIDKTDIINDTKEITTEISKFNTYIKSVNDTYENIDKIGSEIVRIDDLLTVFQGAVPIEGCIIVAMTNHFEELRRDCPALFRPGRLTPVYFGYFTIEILNKVCVHYFGREVECDCDINTELIISPSHVMEILSFAMGKENKYEYFITKMSELNKIEFRGKPVEFKTGQTCDNFKLFNTGKQSQSVEQTPASSSQDDTETTTVCPLHIIFFGATMAGADEIYVYPCTTFDTSKIYLLNSNVFSQKISVSTINTGSVYDPNLYTHRVCKSCKTTCLNSFGYAYTLILRRTGSEYTPDLSRCSPDVVSMYIEGGYSIGRGEDPNIMYLRKKQ